MAIVRFVDDIKMKPKIRVLIIDDDEVDCMTARRALQSCPYPVEFESDTAGTLSNALDKLDSAKYDVALLDLGLPDSTGLDTVKKAINTAKDVPIVVLTGLADDRTGLSAIDIGAADYIVKDPSIGGVLGRILLYALERKKGELKLKEALNARAELVNMVSHDLRIPLTAVREGIGIVMAGEAGAVNEEQKDFLGLARRNVDRLSRMITDFLDYQKIEADRQKFNIRLNDLNELIKGVHKTMVPLAIRKGLEFCIELEGGLPGIEFDYDGITRVVTNLVSNALRFTEQGGIVIRTQKTDALRPPQIGDGVVVAVSDTGCGIRAEDMKLIFKKYGQVRFAAVKDDEGTGLGLVISKQIVEFHSGKIWAESQPGRGSTFSFYLPALS
jgi:signal transduction histidine kinase